MKHGDALKIAERVQSSLLPYYERCQLAGSLRRQKEDVGDIELLAIPKMLPTFDLFGQQTGENSLLDYRRVYEPLGKVLKAGKRYVQLELFDGINLDLFVVLPPAQWGVLMAIRTGPADFSKWIVTNRSKGGALHNGWRCEDGRIWDGQVELDFQEEEKFLEWLDLGWIEPSERERRNGVGSGGIIVAEYYKGEDIYVRVVHKRNGEVAYGLCRWWKNNSIIDQFDSLEFANLVAKYIDEHGGGYGAAARMVAKKYAELVIRARQLPEVA